MESSYALIWYTRLRNQGGGVYTCGASIEVIGKGFGRLPVGGSGNPPQPVDFPNFSHYPGGEAPAPDFQFYVDWDELIHQTPGPNGGYALWVCTLEYPQEII